MNGFLSGWQDSNLRPPAPKAGAIPGYATPRTSVKNGKKQTPFFFRRCKDILFIDRNDVLPENSNKFASSFK